MEHIDLKCISVFMEKSWD